MQFNSCLDQKIKQQESNMHYIRALWHKRLKLYDDSNAWYRKFMKMALKNKRRELTKYIWGLILVPIMQEK